MFVSSELASIGKHLEQLSQIKPLANFQNINAGTV
jgi:hypothetical protein